jgi:hypothetical protein
LKAFVRANRSMPAEVFADALIERVRQWTGGGAQAFDDDLTIVVVDIVSGE